MVIHPAGVEMFPRFCSGCCAKEAESDACAMIQSDAWEDIPGAGPMRRREYWPLTMQGTHASSFASIPQMACMRVKFVPHCSESRRRAGSGDNARWSLPPERKELLRAGDVSWRN